MSRPENSHSTQPSNTAKNPFNFVNQVKDLPPAPRGACLTDNRAARLRTLWKHYALITAANLRKGASPLQLARRHFPFLLPTAATPPGVHVEFTNHCNLRCAYCTSPLKLRSVGMMNDETFHRLTSQVRAAGIQWVYVIGNGEPTLHPEFSSYVRELARSTRFLSVTSNWQRVNEAIVRGILEAPVDLLNISVDGDDAESYESSRLGGSFPRLLNNLAHLREMRRAFPRRTLVNLRVMLRPSQARRLQEIRRFWSEYADEVSLQFVVDDAGTGGDVYGVHTVRDRYPRCSLTFKQLNVHWNGDVPLCTYATRQADQSEDAYLGNIHDQTLEELWQHALIVQYRKAHRERLCGQMPLCNGCGGF